MVSLVSPTISGRDRLRTCWFMDFKETDRDSKLRGRETTGENSVSSVNERRTDSNGPPECVLRHTVYIVNIGHRTRIDIRQTVSFIRGKGTNVRYRDTNHNYKQIPVCRLPPDKMRNSQVLIRLAWERKEPS